MPMLCRAVCRKVLPGGGNLKSAPSASRYPNNGCGSSDNGLRSNVRTAKREGSRCGEREPSFFMRWRKLGQIISVWLPGRRGQGSRLVTRLGLVTQLPEALPRRGAENPDFASGFRVQNQRQFTEAEPRVSAFPGRSLGTRTNYIGAVAGAKGPLLAPAERSSDLPHRLLESILVFHERHAAVSLPRRSKTAAGADRHVGQLQQPHGKVHRV